MIGIQILFFSLLLLFSIIIKVKKSGSNDMAEFMSSLKLNEIAFVQFLASSFIFFFISGVVLVSFGV